METDPTENFKINLNQNIWGLVIGLTALGFAEFYHLTRLLLFGTIISAMGLISLFFTTWSYTRHYCKKKERYRKEEEKAIKS
jgi:hypothetical protein